MKVTEWFPWLVPGKSSAEVVERLETVAGELEEVTVELRDEVRRLNEREGARDSD